KGFNRKEGVQVFTEALKELLAVLFSNRASGSVTLSNL
ncbi:hypothetical protein Goarm_008925, partial [Gossypium armourianum]|nr:hypothetical protein [Gossypium armourianum]